MAYGGSVTWAQGSPLYLVRDWLAALTQVSGVVQPGHPVVHTLGPQAGAEITAAERFEWEPQGLDLNVPSGFVRADVTGLVGDTESAGNPGGYGVDFIVTIVSADFDSVVRLGIVLAASIDLLFGPPQGDATGGGGYKLGKSSKPMQGGVPGASAWSCTVPVTLTDSIQRRVFPPSPIVSATLQVDLANATGAEQAIPIAEGPP